MSETLEVGGLTFAVRRSQRRKTLGLVVDRGAALVVQAPQDTGSDELARWVQSRLLWVHRKLALKAQLAPNAREPEFVTGESFGYLGRTYRLVITAGQDRPLRFDRQRFHLRADARPCATDHFRSWYVSVGRPWVDKRVAFLAPRAGVVPTRITIGDLGYRWGSCSRDGLISLNWRLLQLPVRLADYVIAHELAHLVEPHHGPAFLRVLDRSMPDWGARKEELTRKAREVYWCSAGMAQ
jgi:predicted metal-dependent hydrolase